MDNRSPSASEISDSDVSDEDEDDDDASEDDDHEDGDQYGDEDEDPEKNPRSAAAARARVSPGGVDRIVPQRFAEAILRLRPPRRSSPGTPRRRPSARAALRDLRIVNPDIRDAMLQSISVLLQYKEYVAVFEANEEARRRMVPALLPWRLTRGSGSPYPTYSSAV